MPARYEADEFEHRGRIADRLSADRRAAFCPPYRHSERLKMTLHGCLAVDCGKDEACGPWRGGVSARSDDQHASDES